MHADSGLVVVDKPGGMTSHQVVARVRRLAGTRKVGHAGTLDPMATGVLLVGVNRATRLLGHLALHDKRYLATIRLGEQTLTDDAEGEVVARADADGVSDAALAEAVAALTGTISQVPSSVSAIKVDGKRAYALSRAGQDVALKPREVTVSRFDLGEVRRGGKLVDVDVDVECTSGTYVRALARDLGRALGVGGHLTMLRRVRVGGFTLDDVGLSAADAASREPAELRLMSMAELARRSFPVVELSEDEARDVGYGRALCRCVPADPTAVLSPDGALLALYRPGERGGAVPVTVLVG